MSISFISIILTGILVSSTTTATVTIEVELVSYNNPTSEDCDGGHCEGLLEGTCDNQFDFCVRQAGSFVCLTNILSSEEISDDSLSFTPAPSVLDNLGLNNPLRFNNVPTTNPLEIFIEVTDIDIGEDDPVDRIIVTIPRDTRANGQQSPLMTYTGSCGRGTFALRFSITSNCPANSYGPQCQCTEIAGRRVCNYLGESTCVGNRKKPDCTECDDNFQEPTCTMCTPRYTDPNTLCRTCSGNFKEPDCTQCDDNFTGTNCDTCSPNYYPAGVCSTFCSPRNDSLSRYTCNTRTGDRICLDGYTGPKTNCITPAGSSTASSSEEEFVGSTVFIAIIAVVVGVPLIAFIIILFILCVLCFLSSDVNCSCPKIDCENCCDSFFKSLSCGLKCDDCNPFVICAFVVLGILAAPFIIVFGIIGLVLCLLIAGLYYGLVGCLSGLCD